MSYKSWQLPGGGRQLEEERKQWHLSSVDMVSHGGWTNTHVAKAAWG